MKINCLETAKKAYKDALDNEDIESTYKALNRHLQMTEKSGANLLEEMNNFSKELSEANERANKELLLQQLISTQAILDNLQREELFRKAGHTPQNSVIRSLMGKMTGTSWKVTRNRDNTYSRKLQAADGFYREFAKDIQGELTPLFTSKAGQSDLANALYEHKRGMPIDTPYGRLAAIVIKYQDRYYNKLRSVGIDINELDDRVAPTVHNASRILQLSRAEKKAALEKYAVPGSSGKMNAYGDPFYEFAFQRWNDTILPLVDHDKTFKARNTDPTNAKQLDAFQRAAFDNLVNKGKVSQQNTNFANKFKKSKVYHFKDGDSLVEYNNTFGNDSIQDAILNELSHGFGMIEVIKDWGVSPEATIDRTLKVLDENPVVNQRTGKAEEVRKLRNVMRAMISQPHDYEGTVASIGTSIRAAEAITKMGDVVIASVQDLYNISSVAKQAGRSRFATIPIAMKNLVVGLSDKDKEIVYKFVNTGISNKLGSLARFELNPFSPTSVKSQAVHWMFKLNMLERWDNGNRGYIASSVSQYFAEHRSMGWDDLSDHDKGIFDSYGITQYDWDVIRQSNVKIGSRNKQFITPDSVQEMPADVLIQSLKAQGVENPSAARIESYRDAVERKLSTYFRDRIEHAVVNPDAYDNSLPIFGGAIENPVIRAVVGVMSQFKKFGVAQFRRTVLPAMRDKGATNYAEMLYGGKSNWIGIGKMGVEMMALAYVVMSLKNLSKNLTPPDIDKTSTWVEMTKSAMGVLALGLQIDPKDLIGSTAKIAAGAGFSDIAKASKLAYYFGKETLAGRSYKNTKKAAYQLFRGTVPYNTFMTRWIWNHIFLNELEDSAYPGKRRKDLRQVKKNTGATQLF